MDYKQRGFFRGITDENGIVITVKGLYIPSINIETRLIDHVFNYMDTQTNQCDSEILFVFDFMVKDINGEKKMEFDILHKIVIQQEYKNNLQYRIDQVNSKILYSDPENDDLAELNEKLDSLLREYGQLYKSKSK